MKSTECNCPSAMPQWCLSGASVVPFTLILMCRYIRDLDTSADKLISDLVVISRYHFPLAAFLDHQLVITSHALESDLTGAHASRWSSNSRTRRGVPDAPKSQVDRTQVAATRLDSVERPKPFEYIMGVGGILHV